MNKVVKRSLDIFISLSAIIFMMPLILLLALLIKLDSKGPVFFVQKRIGHKGRYFNIIKFRTMIVNAEYQGDGLSIKSDNDTRITKIGAVLRKTSLDELPQFFNVLIGDMSIVGPRPPVVYYPYNGIESYPKLALKRFEMRPGITGLAQIKVRNSVSWEDRIKIDIHYVENYSLLLDVKIFFGTIKQIFLSDNIY